MSYPEGGVVVVASDGPGRENTNSDGDTNLQNQQNQEEAERSVQRHLRHQQQGASDLESTAVTSVCQKHVKSILDQYKYSQ